MSAPPPPAAQSWLQRLLTPLLQRPLLGGLGLLVLAGLVGGSTLLLVTSQDDLRPASLPEALDLLAAEDFEGARDMATRLADSPQLAANEKGVPPYLIGMALVRAQCERERQAERKSGLYLIAARYFDEADLQGVPESLQADVDYWWGKSLFLGNQLPAARAPLIRALNGKPELKKEILPWLLQVHLADDQLSNVEGLSYADQLLVDSTLSPEERQQAESLKARLLLKDKQIEPAVAILDALPIDSPKSGEVATALSEAYLNLAALQTETRRPPDEIKQTFAQAVEVLNRYPGGENDGDLQRARRLFILGQAQKGAGDLTAAAENFTYVRRQFFDQPIGIAAGFWEAQCLLEEEAFADALNLFASMLREVVRPNNQGESEWLNQKSISDMVERAIDRYLAWDDCASAVKLADFFRIASTLREPAIPLGDAARLKSIALQRWIDLLESQYENANFYDRKAIKERIKEKYDQYGHALYSLAIHRYASKNFATDLYRAGEAFFQAEDFERATLAFQQYLDTGDQTQAAQTRLRIGQSLLAQRNFSQAIEQLSNCWILFANDPVVYQARYQAAECYLELSDPVKSQQMLRANLDNDALTPSSQEWINSLFLLGDLLFEEGLKLESLSQSASTNGSVANPAGDPIELLEQSFKMYQESIVRLNEAVQRADRLPAAKLGRYYLADAYRRSNRWNEMQLSRTTINATRVQLAAEIRRSDEKAIEHFQKLEDHLAEIREQRPLDANEEALLRNSLFARGNLYFRLNEFEESIKMYRSASNLVIQQPEVLEAYVQIAACYRRLNRNEEATRIINQAKILLRDRIPVDATFETTTRFSRDRWVTLLDWLSNI